jgi:hypothetical protein
MPGALRRMRRNACCERGLIGGHERIAARQPWQLDAGTAGLSEVIVRVAVSRERLNKFQRKMLPSRGDTVASPPFRLASCGISR